MLGVLWWALTLGVRVLLWSLFLVRLALFLLKLWWPIVLICGLVVLHHHWR